jgi:galactonate dehydratase
MKITGIETFACSFPASFGFSNSLFVVVDTDEGISGVGESGLAGRELAVVATIEHLKPAVIGSDPNRIEHIWQTLSRGGFFPAGPIAASAIAAIDIALWDIQGKARGAPVYQLLGGRTRDRVVCYPHNQGGRDLDRLVESCRQSVAEGWKFVRLNITDDGGVLEPSESIRVALKQFEAVRAAVGDEIEIVFDVHTRLDLPDAVRLCREAEQFHPFFMEDPLRSENTHSYRALRHQVATPIAAGEQFASKWQFRELIEDDLIDYARVDLCIAGGLTEARKIAGWCETHYIKLALHNPLGPVCTAACVQLDLACGNFGVQEQPRRPGTFLNDVFPVQIGWEDGYLLPSDRPGLGIEFDREAARRYPYHPWELPRLRRLDGSLTNW